ncbi:MAG: hypothetical protein WD075_06565, partial [Rhodospirillales bacterium]
IRKEQGFVVEHTLIARSPLDGYSEIFMDTRLEEVPGLAIVSIAVPQGGKTALDKAMQDAFGAMLPDTGRITTSDDNKIRFLGMSPDQVFALYDEPEAGAETEIETTLAGCGYFTRQSDNWVKLRISGPATLAALERICPVDLDPAAFPENRVARTVFEHMGSIVLGDGEEGFLLLSAASSARAFLDAVRESIIRL